METSKLLVRDRPQYTEILDQFDESPEDLDNVRLQDMIEQLKVLYESAENRVESCEKAVRLIHEQVRDVEFDQKERDRQAQQTRRSKKRRDRPSNS